MKSILRFALFISLTIATTFTSYSQVQKGLDIDGLAAGDESGRAISMGDVNTVAVGALFNDSIDDNAGSVTVYQWDGAAWIQKGGCFFGDSIGERFGGAVFMLDGNTIAMGGTRHDGGALNGGRAQIFEWNGSAWIQKGGDLFGENDNDYFGTSVSMGDANTIAVGAALNDSSASNAGAVNVFTWNGSAWVQKGDIILGEGFADKFGSVIDMPDANTVAIASLLNDGNGSNAGHVRIFEWNGSAWVQKGVDIDGEAANDFAGMISMPDNNTIAVGASQYDGSVGANCGHVRVFTWDGSAWTLKGVGIEGSVANERAGTSVYMFDINTLAIGAYNGSSGFGNAKIFEWDGTAWVQRGATIAGEAAGDNFGWTIQMPDVNTVGVGARFNDGNGSNAGHVRIYDLSPSVLPVELISFEGSLNEREIELTWSTATEINNQGFEIQRATGTELQLGNWTTIGYVEGNGDSQQQIDYSHVDPSPESEINYYRLKQYDYDGAYNYSQVIGVSLSRFSEFLIYPNPVTSGHFFLSLEDKNIESTELSIYTTSGQRIKRVLISTSIQQIEVDGLNQGSYFIEVNNDNGSFRQKLIVQ